MKKFFSLVLALVMALSLTTVAWGATTIYVDGTTGDDATTDSTVTPYKTVSAAVAAAANGDTIYVAAGTYDKLATISGKTVTIDCEDGVVFTGTSSLNINGSTVDGATFSNPGGTVISGTINGIAKNCTFTGGNALRWCYTGATTEFYDCVLEGSTYGIHFDGGSTTALFDGCTISGFNAIGVPVTLRDCTFQAKEGNNYNGVNLWDDTVMEGCEFVFDGEAGTEWVDMCSANQTLKVTDSVVTDGAGGEKTLDTVIGREVSAKNGDTFYSTLQDAIDEGGTVILMADAGEIEVGEGVTIVPNGYDVTVKAADGSDVILNTDGELVVVPAVTFGDKYDLYLADKNMNTMLKLKAPSVAGLSFDEKAAKVNQDGSGNVAYIVANNGEYYVKTTTPYTTSYAVTYAGKTDVLYYVNVGSAGAGYYTYEEEVVAFDKFSTYDKCDCVTATPAATDVYFQTEDGTVYKAKASVEADATKNYLLNGKVVTAGAEQDVVDHKFVASGYKYDTTYKVNVPTSALCTKCLMTSTSIYKDGKVPAGLKFYELWDGNNTTDYSVVAEASAPSVGGTTGGKVESAETFDAGIALYVGMSVMAAAGSAVVIGKKKD